MTRTPSTAIEAAVLDAAEELLAAKGADALSVRRIAAVAGVAPMSVYNHYGSKSGVIEALFVSGFQRLGAELSSLAEISDPLEALLEGGHRYRRLALDHPAAYRVMFECAVPGFEPSDAAKEVAFAAFSSLVAAVERAMSSGLIADDEPTTVAQMVWATVHGWVSIELSEMSFVEDHDAGAKTLLDTMMRGLRAQG